MYYDLDDMYSMLNEYKEQDAKQVIERQEVAEQESNAVMELHPAENSESVSSIPNQQEDTGNQEKIPREKDHELVVPVNEKSGYMKSSDRSIRVSDVDFRKSDKKTSASETCALRDIPKCLVEMAKRSFPHTPNYIAVSAFLFAHRDKESEDIDYSSVPDNIKDLAKTYERRNDAMRTSADIRRINDNLRKLNKVSDEVILALSYLVYDANGFRRTEPAHPGDIDFYDPGIQKVTEQLERTSDKLCSERDYQQGKKKNMYGQKGQI